MGNIFVVTINVGRPGIRIILIHSKYCSSQLAWLCIATEQRAYQSAVFLCKGFCALRI